MDFQQAAIFFGCLVVAVILHEITHGLVALFFGDETAKRAGRITLNPVPHIDPFGSVILPAIGALSGVPVIGWAKPVPVNPQRLRNPRSQMLMVSLAGPASNFLLMGVAAIATRWFVASGGGNELLVDVLFSFALVNLGLGVFNLLPIPPLDGSALIERVLPASAAATYERIRPYGILIILVLVMMTGILGRILQPFYNALFAFVTGG